jgi:hypothetical protein
VDERELRHGYRYTTGADIRRDERLVAACVCGVDIVSMTGHAEDVMRAVKDHNDTSVHLLWRHAQAFPPDPTAPVNTVDVSGHEGASGPAGEAA